MKVWVCLRTQYAESWKQICPYNHRFWRFALGYICMDDKNGITNSIKDAYVEAIQAKNLGSCGMTNKGVHAWWPCVHRDIIINMAKWNLCTKIGKNLKQLIPSWKRARLELFKIFTEEFQTDNSGPIFNEMIQPVNFVSLNCSILHKSYGRGF